MSEKADETTLSENNSDSDSDSDTASWVEDTDTKEEGHVGSSTTAEIKDEKQEAEKELPIVQQIQNIWMYDRLVRHLHELDEMESEVRHKLFALTRKYLTESFQNDPLMSVFASCIFSTHINFQTIKNRSRHFLKMTSEQYKMFEEYLDMV